MSVFMTIMLSVLAIATGVLLIVFLLVPAFRGVGWLVRHVFAFVGGMVSSLLRVLGGMVTAVVLIPLILLNVVIGRWSAAGHFGRSLQDECVAIGRGVYRFCIGHPARFLLLSPLVEGLEQRVPQAVAQAPGSDKPNKRVGQFDGYTIVGSLRGGGSGGRLYIAEPDERKRAAFSRRGVEVDQVVIKAFSLADGSSLPQIVRESRALDAARKTGLVLEHELTDKRFFYVMRYVPGDTLTIVTQRLHEKCDASGLSDASLVEGLRYALDLVETLDVYHSNGLWHKDVKPDNIIVSEGQAHLVDFGLVTPLRSAMTLTTHGTEYFRDPEMVRLALKGVKVHEVNGAKFDVYAAGAVLYSIVEKSFPAHGGLSQITKRCPEGVRWIVRRAMAEYDSRYDTAHEMLDDLRAVAGAPDPFAVLPADLPSMTGKRSAHEVAARAFDRAHEEAAEFAQARSPAARAAPAAGAPGAGAARVPGGAAAARAGAARARVAPRIRVASWFTGRIEMDGAQVAAARSPAPGRAGGRSAQAQLQSARGRVEAARARAAARMGRPAPRFDTRPNAGVVIAFLVFLTVCAFAAVAIVGNSLDASRRADEARAATAAADAARDVRGLGEVFAAFAEGFRPGEEWPVASGARGVRFEGAAGPSAQAAVRVEGRWLVLDDFVGSPDASARRRVDSTLEGLRAMGGTLVGMGTEESELALVASARAALGVASFDDEEARERLESWVSTRSEVTGVVWFARGEEPNRPEIVVVGGSGRALGAGTATGVRVE